MHPEDPQFTETISQSISGGLARPVDEAAAKKPLEPGDSIGRYRIRERIGEGGMGVVYAAEDPELGRVVAIKLLRPLQGDDAEVQQRRMLREAQALARLSHRNLVMVFDVGSRHGRVWIAMEYVVGDTLEVWLDRDHRTWGEIVDVFIEAGRGLSAVHAAGLVHRDFKPGNVLVRADGTVQVLDLGLAARAGERDDEAAVLRARALPDLDAFAANLTKTGGLMGTPAYMAPEQFLLQPADGRADQFGFCVALYEAIYGHRPFTGKDLAQLMANSIAGLKGLPAEIPGLPLAVRQVIARGLAGNPADRFPDMEALVRALAATRSPPVKSSLGLGRFALGMIVGGGALAIGTAVLLTQPDDDSDPASAPAPTAAPSPAHEGQAAPPGDARTPAVAAEPGDEDEPYIVEDAAAEPAEEPSPVEAQADEGEVAADDEDVLPEPQTPSIFKGLPSVSDLEESEAKPSEPTHPPAEPTKPPPSDSTPAEPTKPPPSEPAKPAKPPSEPSKVDPPPSDPPKPPSDDAPTSE
jgi:serine/threonine protein kinase